MGRRQGGWPFVDYRRRGRRGPDRLTHRARSSTVLDGIGKKGRAAPIPADAPDRVAHRKNDVITAPPPTQASNIGEMVRSPPVKIGDAAWTETLRDALTPE